MIALLMLLAAAPADGGTANDDSTVLLGAMPPRILGPVRREDVDRVVMSRRADLAECLVAARVTNPLLAGRLSVKFTIASTGKVANAKVESSTLRSAKLAACLVGKARSWEFRPPDDEAVAVVTYPITFLPPTARK